MQKIKNLILRTNPFYIVCGYLILFSILILFKIKPYEFNLSSLIGIWKGFTKLNPELIEKNFIIYYDGGYDGQFFYLISKSLYTNGFSTFPILDSFYLRFNRVGLSILSGFFSNILGFNFYPIITLALVTFFHVLSFFLFFRILKNNNRYLAYFYLFSPFSLNSNLLLVSDSLFVSFCIICIYIVKNWFGVNLFGQSEYVKLNTPIKSYIFGFLVFTFTCFIRESGLVFLVTFFLLCLFDRNKKAAIPIILGIAFYIIITQLLKLIPNVDKGTNPLGFLDLIDYPLKGFYQSIQFQSLSNLKNLIRDLAKFPIFIFYILLFLNILNIKNKRDFISFLPVYFILFTAGVGEVGYWLSFDNISRMFTLSIICIILAKDNYDNLYNDFHILSVSVLILLFLIIRILFIKSPMRFYIF